MKRTTRLITLSAIAVLAVGLAAAQQLSGQSRDRWSRDRDSRSETTSRPVSTQPQGQSSSSSSSYNSSSSSSSSSFSSSRQAYSDRYAVLEQRNIFVKDRSRGVSRSFTSSSTTQQTRRSAEESLVLRGTAMEDGGLRAYVEDLNTSSTITVSPGDKLARGHVLSVVHDAIAYEHDGKQSWIDIGSDFTGKQSAAPSPYASAATATTGPTSLPFDANDPNLTTEQKMRLRRFQAQQPQQQQPQPQPQQQPR